jgi:hypothetical protein
MNDFSVANLQSADGPQAAIEVKGNYYQLRELLPSLQDVSLAPGDILFTGSPSGSAGVHGNRWLKPGDRIRASIEHIGVFEVGIQTTAAASLIKRSGTLRYSYE